MEVNTPEITRVFVWQFGATPWAWGVNKVGLVIPQNGGRFLVFRDIFTQNAQQKFRFKTYSIKHFPRIRLTWNRNRSRNQLVTLFLGGERTAGRTDVGSLEFLNNNHHLQFRGIPRQFHSGFWGVSPRTIETSLQFSRIILGPNPHHGNPQPSFFLVVLSYNPYF